MITVEIKDNNRKMSESSSTRKGTKPMTKKEEEKKEVKVKKKTVTFADVVKRNVDGNSKRMAVGNKGKLKVMNS